MNSDGRMKKQSIDMNTADLGTIDSITREARSYDVRAAYYQHRVDSQHIGCEVLFDGSEEGNPPIAEYIFLYHPSQLWFLTMG